MTRSPPPPILAVDTGSPVPGVALHRAGGPTSERVAEPRACSERLLGLVDEVLSEAGLGLEELGGLVALRGPGSFTGLRVGLATVLGLHQALGLPATGLPTLQVLGRWALAESDAAACLAVVDALRDHWFVARIERGGPAIGTEPATRRLPTAALAAESAGRDLCLAGFGAPRLAVAIGHCGPVLEPRSLAPAAALQAHQDPPGWDAGLLVRPLYLQGPAVTVAPGAS